MRLARLMIGIALQVVACSFAVNAVIGLGRGLGTLEVIVMSAIAALLAVAGHRLRSSGVSESSSAGVRL